MKRYAGYAALLIGAYLVFLIALLPAAHAVRWAQAMNMLPATLYQVDGTLWRGTARTAVIGNQVAGPLDWTFRPFALLTGRVEFALGLGRGNNGRIDTIAGRTFGGALYLRDARLAMSLNDVALMIGQPDMGLTGRVDAELRRARVDAGSIALLEGRADVTGAGVGAPVNVALGNFVIDIETGGEVIRATLKDREGPLQADGVVVLNPDGSYRFTATLGARDPANTQLTQALAMMGRPGQGGRVTVTQQGRFVLPAR